MTLKSIFMMHGVVCIYFSFMTSMFHFVFVGNFTLIWSHHKAMRISIHCGSFTTFRSLQHFCRRLVIVMNVALSLVFVKVFPVIHLPRSIISFHSKLHLHHAFLSSSLFFLIFYYHSSFPVFLCVT